MFFKAFDQVNEYWRNRMYKDADAYTANRKKNKKSASEENAWLSDALKKLKKVSTELKRQIAYKLRQEPSIPNLQGGLIDFTKGFPETHIIHFMNGNLYTANTRIYVVYKDFVGNYIEKPFDIDGFYDLEILFIKKVKEQDVGRKSIPATDVGELRS